jgi:hypothetical protein
LLLLLTLALSLVVADLMTLLEPLELLQVRDECRDVVEKFLIMHQQLMCPRLRTGYVSAACS